MANRKPRTRCVSPDIQSINMRLNRIHTMALYLQVELSQTDSQIPFMCVPSVLSYLADDINEIKRLINNSPE
ncbi:hypothetical protein AH715_001977 [Salmonella enterica subsp. enterica]|nr:hypothetical protein [Salmonella enterica subsp. enterica serovar Lomalinda]ECI5766489.1 hypothetical protein [Salmonella enterica subsp. enterica]EDU0501380.1 hypothetical protein [Salmonella enterica subsp. salamae]EEI9680864.1 hypothetical protein [Salmonella enterica]ECI5317370.1 hypothetical protein [Salmonella enterica subsp. enterica serovar Lomalinda]